MNQHQLQMIGGLQHRVERTIGIGKGAKSPMNVAHEKGGGQPFSRNIPQQKEQITVVFKQIATISANRARRRIVIVHLPPIKGRGSAWQECSLNNCCLREFVFQGVQFIGCESTETEI